LEEEKELVLMVWFHHLGHNISRGRDYLRELDIDGRIILKLILEKHKRYGLDWTDLE
jgi:hypothetical protein